MILLFAMIIITGRAVNAADHSQKSIDHKNNIEKKLIRSDYADPYSSKRILTEQDFENQTLGYFWNRMPDLVNGLKKNHGLTELQFKKKRKKKYQTIKLY